MLDSTIKNEVISIKGFSSEIFCNDHPSNSKTGGGFWKQNGLFQLIDEPTNIRNEGMSCIDLIITDQPNMFFDCGVHPSLDVHCQHHIIFGNMNLSLPSPPPYKRTVWHYSKANVQVIKNSITNVNWVNSFNSLSPTEMHFDISDILGIRLLSLVP